MKMMFKIVFTDKAVLKSNIRKASLTGKKNLYMNLDYNVSIDPMNPKSFIKERLGGKLELTSKDFKKVIKTYQLK